MTDLLGSETDYKLILSSVQDGKQDDAAERLAQILGIDTVGAGILIKAAPIILLDNLTEAEAETAMRNAENLRKAGAEITVAKGPVGKLKKATWPESARVKILERVTSSQELPALDVPLVAAPPEPPPSEDDIETSQQEAVGTGSGAPSPPPSPPSQASPGVAQEGIKPLWDTSVPEVPAPAAQAAAPPEAEAPPPAPTSALPREGATPREAENGAKEVSAASPPQPALPGAIVISCPRCRAALQLHVAEAGTSVETPGTQPAGPAGEPAIPPIPRIEDLLNLDVSKLPPEGLAAGAPVEAGPPAEKAPLAAEEPTVPPEPGAQETPAPAAQETPAPAAQEAPAAAPEQAPAPQAPELPAETEEAVPAAVEGAEGVVTPGGQPEPPPPVEAEEIPEIPAMPAEVSDAQEQIPELPVAPAAEEPESAVPPTPVEEVTEAPAEAPKEPPPSLLGNFVVRIDCTLLDDQQMQTVAAQVSPLVGMTPEQTLGQMRKLGKRKLVLRGLSSETARQCAERLNQVMSGCAEWGAPTPKQG